MSDMPETIWATPYQGEATFTGCYWLEPYGKAVQFLRADTAISKVALRELVEEMISRHSPSGHDDFCYGWHDALDELREELCPDDKA